MPAFEHLNEEDLDCPHWCKRKTLHLGGLEFARSKIKSNSNY